MATIAASAALYYGTVAAVCITKVCRAKPDDFLFFGRRQAVEGSKADLLLLHRTKDIVNDMSRAAYREITGGQDGVPQDDRDKLTKRLSFYFNEVKDTARRIRVQNDQKEYMDDFDLGVGTNVGEQFPVVLTRLQTQDGVKKDEAVQLEKTRIETIANVGIVGLDIDASTIVVGKKKSVSF